MENQINNDLKNLNTEDLIKRIEQLENDVRQINEKLIEICSTISPYVVVGNNREKYTYNSDFYNDLTFCNTNKSYSL